MSTAEPVEDVTKSHVSEPDWFLQHLTALVNRSSGTFDFGITLQVGGMLVSGNLVHGGKYFEGFADEFSTIFAADDSEVAEGVRASLAAHGKIYEKSEEGKELPPPIFIHLKNARFYNTSGKPIPSNRGVWWRGRISEVGGFTLGTLSFDPS